MTKRRRKRIVERVKSVLILLLSCSAVYLVMLIQSTVVPSGLLSHPSTGGGGLAAADPAETARPLRMAAVIPAGGSEVQRFGVQYSDADTADLFQQAYTILVEALSSANQPKEVTEAEWRQALAAAPGLYFDWQGEVPLAVLDGWLSVDNPLLTGSVRRMVLAAREGRVFLCYFDETAGRYYACGSDVVSVRRLEEVVEALRDNGARFAFETEEYGGLEPYTLVLEQPLSPAVYASVDPLEGGQRLGALQEALDFPESSASFSGVDEQVIRSRNDTLRIGANGTVTYEPAAEGSDRYPLPGTGIYEAVEGCRDLAQRAVSAVGGEERLFLLSAQETGQNSWEIRFGYSLNGIQVRLGEDGWAARFTVEQGRITGFQLRTRRYTDAGTTTVVLPERQAMAAMEAKGHENEELLLVYLDTGAEMVTASWAADSELSGRR